MVTIVTKFSLFHKRIISKEISDGVIVLPVPFFENLKLKNMPSNVVMNRCNIQMKSWQTLRRTQKMTNYKVRMFSLFKISTMFGGKQQLNNHHVLILLGGRDLNDKSLSSYCCFQSYNCQTLICWRIFYESWVYAAKNLLTVLITVIANRNVSNVNKNVLFNCGMSFH